MNGGQKIFLRLRPAHAPDTFLDEEDVTSTMLHELTHNVHGPHDDKFYKLLSELEDEYEALKRSGYSGEGFHTKGRRLGENVSHNLPAHIARQRALDAAEKRRRIAGIVGGSRRLGGVVPKRNLSPRELAAAVGPSGTHSDFVVSFNPFEQAAERRARDEKSCASGETAQREAANAAQESIQDEVIDLTADSDSEVIILDESLPSGEVVKVAATIHKPMGKQAAAKQQAKRSTSSLSARSERSRSKARKARLSTPPPSGTVSPVVSRGSPLPMSDNQWRCPRCTLLNEPRTLQCQACLLIRPEEAAPAPKVADTASWACLQCGETGMDHQFWSCRFCGAVKTESVYG
ncbi:hypothetical protein EIP86_002622 [Pleurotus ostreatoroseus]|nr:hypothetical protein EIP86_002622 [Pleurotus ostreatoroseus]